MYYILYIIYIYIQGYIISVSSLDVFLEIEFWFMFISPASRQDVFVPGSDENWSYQLVGLFFTSISGNIPTYGQKYGIFIYLYLHFRILLTLQKVTKTSVVKSHIISAKCW